MDESKEKMSVDILVKLGDVITTHLQRAVKMLDDILENDNEIN